MRLLFLMFFTFLYLNGGGILDIKWPKKNKAHQKPSIPYPSVLVKGTKDVKLPVYLSSSYAHNKNIQLVSDRDFYSISLLLDGATVLFEGDRTYQVAVSASNAKFQKVVQKVSRVEYSKSEEIMMAEFNRHGANYAISVECDNPKRDKRCTEESFVKNLYNRIIMVGGRP